MMDGVSMIDTGSNRPLLQMNVESIQEVKVLTSNYQAEYGRSSGLQITAVTKSGTNRFRGSVYDVERNSDWNANSKTNKLNGDAKPISKERDWGFSIGGPVGKPGGSNKLFFFYARSSNRGPAAATSSATACRRRSSGRAISRRRPTTSAICTTSSRTRASRRAPATRRARPRASPTAACSERFPANMLYQTGLNILSMFPLPTIDNVPVGQAYNFEMTRPNETILGVAAGPPARLPGLLVAPRVSYKYSGWSSATRSSTARCLASTTRRCSGRR